MALDFTWFGVELTLIELIAALKFCVSSLFAYDGDTHDDCIEYIKFKIKNGIINFTQLIKYKIRILVWTQFRSKYFFYHRKINDNISGFEQLLKFPIYMCMTWRLLRICNAILDRKFETWARTRCQNGNLNYICPMRMI